MYMHMRKGELITLDIDHNGVRIRCRSGKVWITQEGDSRDYILGTGQQVELAQRGRVAVTALMESQCFPETLQGVLPALQVVPARG